MKKILSWKTEALFEGTEMRNGRTIKPDLKCFVVRQKIYGSEKNHSLFSRIVIIFVLFWSEWGKEALDSWEGWFKHLIHLWTRQNILLWPKHPPESHTRTIWIETQDNGKYLQKRFVSRMQSSKWETLAKSELCRNEFAQGLRLISVEKCEARVRACVNPWHQSAYLSIDEYLCEYLNEYSRLGLSTSCVADPDLSLLAALWVAVKTHEADL